MRRAHPLFLAAGAALLLPVGNPALLGAQDRAPILFADAHVHLNDPAGWVRLMNAAGVERSVALAGRVVGNAQLLQASRRWPGRFLPLLSVSPEHQEFRAAWEADDERLMPLVDSLLAVGGFYGIGEISVTHFPTAGFPEADFSPNGRSMRALLRLAQNHEVPILVHAEITRLREFEALLTDFPTVTVIWAHGGYTPLFLARRLLEAHPNLVYELSARTWASHPRSPDYTIFQNEKTVWPGWLSLMEAMPSRFLVGTDAAARSTSRDSANIARVQLLLAQLSPQTRRLVAQDNVTRLFRPTPATDRAGGDQGPPSRPN